MGRALLPGLQMGRARPRPRPGCRRGRRSRCWFSDMVVSPSRSVASHCSATRNTANAREMQLSWSAGSAFSPDTLEDGASKCKSLGWGPLACSRHIPAWLPGVPPTPQRVEMGAPSGGDGAERASLPTSHVGLALRSAWARRRCHASWLGPRPRHRPVGRSGEWQVVGGRGVAGCH